MINANANILGAVRKPSPAGPLAPVQTGLTIWNVAFDRTSYPGSGSFWYNKVGNVPSLIELSASFNPTTNLIDFQGTGVNQITWDGNIVPDASSSFTIIQSFIPQNTNTTDTIKAATFQRITGGSGVANESSSFGIYAQSTSFNMITQTGSFIGAVNHNVSSSLPGVTGSVGLQKGDLNTIAFVYDGLNLKMYTMTPGYLFNVTSPFPAVYNGPLEPFPQISGERNTNVPYEFGSAQSTDSAVNFSGSLKGVLYYNIALNPAQLQESMYYLLDS